MCVLLMYLEIVSATIGSSNNFQVPLHAAFLLDSTIKDESHFL